MLSKEQLQEIRERRMNEHCTTAALCDGWKCDVDCAFDADCREVRMLCDEIERLKQEKEEFHNKVTLLLKKYRGNSDVK